MTGQEQLEASTPWLAAISRRFLYIIVAVGALLVGLAYRMGIFGKSGSAAAQALSTAGYTVIKNTPLHKLEVPDVFDGTVPPHSDKENSVDTESWQETSVFSEKQEEAVVEPVKEQASDSTEANVADLNIEDISTAGISEEMPTLKLDTVAELPSIKLEPPIVGDADNGQLPSIQINI